MNFPFNTAAKATCLNEALPSLDIPADALPVLGNGDRILDIGSGIRDSHLLDALLRQNQISNPHVVRSDYFAKNLVGRLGHRVVADAAALPFRSGAFQAVVSSEVTKDNPYFLHHPEHRARMSAEVGRALAIGGTYLVYHEEDTIVIPDGFITIAEHTGKQRLDDRHTADGILFGAYRKVVEVVDIKKIGVNAAIHGKYYEDDFLRYLSATYPPIQTIGEERAAKILDRDWQTFSRFTVDMLGNAEMETELSRTIWMSVQTGVWRSQKSPIPNPSAHLLRLAKQPRPLAYDAQTARDLSLWEMQRSPYFHVLAHDGHIVTMPTQKLIDMLAQRAAALDDGSWPPKAALL